MPGLVNLAQLQQLLDLLVLPALQPLMVTLTAALRYRVSEASSRRPRHLGQ